jgi:prolyl-tRNA editing enzyme YbaK/EbsC (Cys-tRNA(Pro) deacylase)
VPPLPSLIGLKGVLDTKFKDVETMAFNAGHMCKSIVMRTEDFPLEDLTVGDITED